MNASRALTVGMVAYFLAFLTAGLQAQADIKTSLNKKVSTPEIEANTPFADSLEFLAEQFKVKIVLGAKAFEKAGVQLVGEQPVKLAATKDATVGAILESLARQVQGTCVIQKDHVLIVPRKR